MGEHGICDGHRCQHLNAKYGRSNPIRGTSSFWYQTVFKKNAYDFAHMLGQFNWGPMAWMMFAPAAIAIGYLMFVKGSKVQRLSKSIDFLQGSQRWKYLCRQLVDFMVVFGIMGGVGSSVGMEIPIIARVLSQLTGIPDRLGLKLGLFAILFIIFAWTVWHGLNGGIDKLSDLHIWTAIVFLAFVLLVGPTIYILSSETNSLGLLASKFVSLSTNTVPNGTPDIASSETIFYWGWWLSYMPVMGLFIARISKGRTIRQVLLGMLLYGSVGCLSFYAILGGYSLWLQKNRDNRFGSYFSNPGTGRGDCGGAWYFAI